RVGNSVVDIGAFESRSFTIVITGGNGQSATVSASFLNPLVVTVTSPYGDPVQSGLVTFTAPAGGAGATLPASGGTTPRATTDPVGQAPGAIPADIVAGSYAVMANARGATFAAGFSLTNVPDAASAFAVSGFPSPSTAGDAHDFTVTARDRYGNVATGYS